jgi:hypothetical protein
MDPLRTFCEVNGFFNRRIAAEFGYSTRTFDRTLRTGVWHRLRHGYYTYSELWSAMDAYERHRTLCKAVVDRLGPSVVLSHVSSLTVQGIEPWGLPLDRVHVVRLDRVAGRIEAGVAHHRSRLPAEDIVVVDGLPCTAIDRATVEAATQVDGEKSLCLFNQAMNAGAVPEERLLARFESMAFYPATRHLHVPIRICDPRCESIGESRGMWMFWRYGIPAPKPQYEICDRRGVVIYRCDWGWPRQKTYGEFDGKIKYGRLLKPGQTAGDVVFDEKRREDEIRELTGGRMIRLTWDDYDRPQVTVPRLRRALNMAA